MTEEDQQQAVADFLVYIIKLAHSRDGRIGLSEHTNDPRRQLLFLASLIDSSNAVEEVDAHPLGDSAAREGFDPWDDIDGVEADADNGFVEEGDSITFDLSFLGAARNLHEFLLTPCIWVPPSSTSGAKSNIQARKVRRVEIMNPMNRLEEVVYVPNMGARLHQFRSRLSGEDLETVLLDSQAHRCLSAGPILATVPKGVE
ncbi:hypothetical protein B0H14DRAFT_1012774 [Mycena olivaceomarginata]|nr:hypothetical protein B0H14DRAFT_1012774 [Mycena olivaceomarginata]